MARTKAKVSKETKKTTKKKSSTKAKGEKIVQEPAVLRLIRNDSGLQDFADAINGRHEQAVRKMAELTNGTNNLSEFASGYLYFGLHKTEDGYVLREWAPNATEIYVVGDFNKWTESPRYAMKRVKGGNARRSLPVESREVQAHHKSFTHL